MPSTRTFQTKAVPAESKNQKPSTTLRMNFAAIPIQSVFGKFLRLPLRLVPKDAVMPVLQGPLRGTKWIVGSATHGCWLGTYEYPKQRVFASLVTPNSVVYDIGANVGFYSLLAAKCGAKSIVACEPDPKNIAVMKQHLGLNRVTSVTIEQVAVCENDGFENFQFRGAQGELGKPGPQVCTITIDSLLRKYPAPDIIKIDVEGAELRVLQGALNALKSHPSLFVAFDRYSYTWESSIAITDEYGYKREELMAGEFVFG